MSGFVYAIGDYRRVKIGWSTDPFKRLVAIRTSCPFEVRLLGLLRGTQKQEREAQKLLIEWRIDREWFENRGAVRIFVELLVKPKIQLVSRSEHCIAERRAELGLSQVELGARVGVDGMTVSRWERGESVPRRRFWSKLEEITGLQIGEILIEAAE